MGAVVLLGAYAAVIGVIIASQRIPYRAAFDQKLYHLPVIREFSRTWPRFEVWDYLSATTPGYHVLMATVMKAFGDSVVLLQVASAVITGVLLWLLARDGSRRTTAAVAACVCLPIIASPYTLFPAAFMLPDNLGWLGVLAMILIALQRPTGRWMAVGATVLLLLVLTRQVHVWTAGLLWVSAWLGTMEGDPEALSKRVGRVAISIIASVPALFVLALFVRYWGGLVPGRFAEQYPPVSVARIAGSPAAPMLLAMTGAYSVFFLGFLVGPARNLWRAHRWIVVLAAAAGLILSVVPATTYDFASGRRGVLWSIGMKGPVIVGHASVLIVVMSIWGAVCIAAWLSACSRRDRWVLMAALGGFTVSQMPSPETWHRYFDPFIFIVISLLATRAASAHPAVSVWWRRVRIAGPIAMSLGLGVYAAGMFFETGKHAAQRMSDPPPPSKDAEGHQGIDPPVDRLATPKPDGKRFLSW